MIGIYAHHHGSGHIQRCRQIQHELALQGEQSVILSTDNAADVVLEDDAPGPDAPLSGRDVTAGATLHYAPYGNPRIQRRYAAIAHWIAENNPTAFYVDVSVEICIFVRLMGVPVITIAMPGLRDDTPHQLAYAQADAIIAAWPTWVSLSDHLVRHASRVHAVGGISRLTPPENIPRDPHQVVVMAGNGGSTWNRERWRAVEQECPSYHFTFLGGDNRVDDPSELLCSAGVAVIAAGQNSVADVAVTHTPAIVLPQPRPFSEQRLTAQVLADAHLAVSPKSFPSPKQWPDVLRQAAALRPDWSRWQTEGAARRAATVIKDAANGASSSEVALLSLADASRAGHLDHQVNLKPQGVDHITVALGDAEYLSAFVPDSHVVAGPYNLAAARNLAARTGINRGADVLVFLDADCIATPELLTFYREALRAHPDAVVAGPVTYLEPGEVQTSRPRPHPARPNPAPGRIEKASNYDLFWSLSFALRAQTWERIEGDFGGFDPHFQGYGGEDTDFARNLAADGIELYWVGGAHAFHQYHPVSSPPWEHLDDILANTEYFHRKWGEYPMMGWLKQFEAAGAISLVDGTWRRI